MNAVENHRTLPTVLIFSVTSKANLNNTVNVVKIETIKKFPV